MVAVTERRSLISPPAATSMVFSGLKAAMMVVMRADAVVANLRTVETAIGERHWPGDRRRRLRALVTIGTRTRVRASLETAIRLKDSGGHAAGCSLQLAGRKRAQHLGTFPRGALFWAIAKRAFCLSSGHIYLSPMNNRSFHLDSSSDDDALGSNIAAPQFESLALPRSGPLLLSTLLHVERLIRLYNRLEKAVQSAVFDELLWALTDGATLESHDAALNRIVAAATRVLPLKRRTHLASAWRERQIALARGSRRAAEDDGDPDDDETVSSGTGPGIDALPTELLVRVLELLDPLSLCRASMVCRAWRSLLPDALWRPHLLRVLGPGAAALAAVDERQLVTALHRAGGSVLRPPDPWTWSDAFRCALQMQLLLPSHVAAQISSATPQAVVAWQSCGCPGPEGGRRCSDAGPAAAGRVRRHRRGDATVRGPGRPAGRGRPAGLCRVPAGPCGLLGRDTVPLGAQALVPEAAPRQGQGSKGRQRIGQGPAVQPAPGLGRAPA